MIQWKQKPWWIENLRQLSRSPLRLLETLRYLRFQKVVEVLEESTIKACWEELEWKTIARMQMLTTGDRLIDTEMS